MDDNKTPLTHRVTAAAAIYLDGMGVKPVETEVEIRHGWIADLDGYWYPSWTESKKLHLADKACEMLGVPLDDRRDYMPRVYGNSLFTVLVEVKTSRADFTRDARKWLAIDPPANICFVAYPSGVIEQGELPKGWHGLEVTKTGERLRKVHWVGASVFAQHTGLALEFVAAVGVRRDHRTRYAAQRAMVKAWRAEDRERRTQCSASSIIKAVSCWISGDDQWRCESLRDRLMLSGVRKISCHVEKHLEFLDSLRQKTVDSFPATQNNADSAVP